MTVSMGFRISVSLYPAILTTWLLTFAMAGLSPAEHTSLRWTHNRTFSFPEYGFPVIFLQWLSQHGAMGQSRAPDKDQGCCGNSCPDKPCIQGCCSGASGVYILSSCSSGSTSELTLL